jgi:dihydroneopterin aldolase
LNGAPRAIRVRHTNFTYLNKMEGLSRISIVDLEVFYHVGVPDEEREQPQRLLLTVDMGFDFSAAALSDRIERTIDYNALAQDLLKFGEGRSWKLLERLVSNIADMILAEYRPQEVVVEVKKFPIPQARYVSVCLIKTRAS